MVDKSVGCISFIAVVFIFILSLPVFAFSVENLDEIVARKTRMAAATWGYALLENGTTHYWQPETLNYTDTITSNEVWRYTYTPSGKNYTQDISNAQWSADGNRVMFTTDRANSTGPGGTNGMTWFIGNTDGSKLRPGVGLSRVGSNWSVLYPAWNPSLADVAYATGPNAYSFYKNTIGDSSISYTKIFDVATAGSTRRFVTKKSIAPDGSKLYFYDLNNGNNAFVANLFTNTLETASTGYSRQLNFDYHWGETPSSWQDYHDEFVAGALNGVDGIWKYIMPENAGGSWWRSRLTGSGTNNNPVHVVSQTPPYNWGGELEPINSPTPDTSNPWCPQGTVVGTDCMYYFSHFSPDRWGRYGIHSKSNVSPYGTAIADLRNHTYKNIFTGVPWVEHLDWEAFSDWSASSGNMNLPVVYPDQLITTQNYSTNTQKVIASAHIRINGTASAPYESNARPAQSPDGTKVTFHSTFLSNTDSDVQLFWAVAYYPYPSEIKSAAKNGSNVRLTWDYNQGSSCSNSSQTTPRTGPTPNFMATRTYATRGWPHETLDCPPSPREIDKFRVWVSPDNTNWTPAGTTTYNNCRGTNECGMWTENAWTYDYAQANSTTRYYAVTSLEYSGLESRTLGNVWKVTLNANGIVTQQIQQSGYPATPGGKTPFYTTPPPSIAVQFNHKQAPATVAGQYVIKWNAPANASMIRYYNIYSKDGSSPFTNATPLADRQKSRIASIPASSDYGGTGAFRYIDWLGAIDGSTKYIVTAVDYQGNETLSIGAPAATILRRVSP